MTLPIPFDNSYLRLPEQFYTQQAPDAVSTPQWIRTNSALAEQLSIEANWLNSDSALQAFAGNLLPDGAEPISTVYAGHQFGNWNPQLGDGRATLLGEVKTKTGARFDIQLKGAGRTPYSRGGDGRSPLGPVLREYILSEAMYALGVPTTRSLAAVTTGDWVYRDSALPGAILTRVASSHIRIGTFQFFAARGDFESVRLLFEYAAERHFPEAMAAENPPLEFLNAVISAQAELIAKWQLLGFVHGVMNTDNMLVCGETVDYGPCAFMDAYNPEAVFSSIDRQGRYRYSNQPKIGLWNLSWLAQSLIPLIDADQEKAVELAQEAIDAYQNKYQYAYDLGLARKLGFNEMSDSSKSCEATSLLAQKFLEQLAAESLDFTLAFRKLADELSEPDQHEIPDFLFEFPDAFANWISEWKATLTSFGVGTADAADAIRNTNPIFIPRNHLVEAAIRAAEQDSDFSVFHELVDLLEMPYTFDSNNLGKARPPEPEERVYQTFCGT